MPGDDSIDKTPCAVLVGGGSLYPDFSEVPAR